MCVRIYTHIYIYIYIYICVYIYMNVWSEFTISVNERFVIKDITDLCDKALNIASASRGAVRSGRLCLLAIYLFVWLVTCPIMEAFWQRCGCARVCLHRFTSCSLTFINTATCCPKPLGGEDGLFGSMNLVVQICWSRGCVGAQSDARRFTTRFVYFILTGVEIRPATRLHRFGPVCINYPQPVIKRVLAF